MNKSTWKRYKKIMKMFEDEDSQHNSKKVEKIKEKTGLSKTTIYRIIQEYKVSQNGNNS